MGGAARRRVNRVAAAPADGGACALCGSDIQDECTVGRLYTLESTTVHYYCVLLSCCLVQHGDDEEGLFGFLLDDILVEIQRGKKLRCSYCGAGGATLGCCVSSCRKQFHLPCGRRRGALSLFYGNYKSFCVAHAQKQNIPAAVMCKAQARMALAKKSRTKCELTELCRKKGSKPLKVASSPFKQPTGSPEGAETVCVICYEPVSAWPAPDTFWAPCCARDSWFHTPCLQRMALSAGAHYLKCPLCNDKDVFQREVARRGVYVPDRDAAWELEEDAFAELYERPRECAADECACPRGRTYDADAGRWELKLCLMCGSAATHAGCLAAARLICASCVGVAPPPDLDALERIPLTPPAPERGESPERRPLMTHRMSLRRTKPGFSMPPVRRVALTMETVVKLCNAPCNEEMIVDVESMDDSKPSSSRTQHIHSRTPVTQNSHDHISEARNLRCQISGTENSDTQIAVLQNLNPKIPATEKVHTAEGTRVHSPVTRGFNDPIAAEQEPRQISISRDTDAPIPAKDNLDSQNPRSPSPAPHNICHKSITCATGSSLGVKATVLDTQDPHTVSQTTPDRRAERPESDTTKASRLSLGLRSPKPRAGGDRDAIVRELEERILSPLKDVEARVYERLRGVHRREYREAIDAGMRRFRRPAPMCEKKRLIGNMLEKIMMDSEEEGANGVDLAPEVSRQEEVHSPSVASDQSASNDVPDGLSDKKCMHLSPTLHSTPAKENINPAGCNSVVKDVSPIKEDSNICDGFENKDEHNNSLNSTDTTFELPQEFLSEEKDDSCHETPTVDVEKMSLGIYEEKKGVVGAFNVLDSIVNNVERNAKLEDIVIISDSEETDKVRDLDRENFEVTKNTDEVKILKEIEKTCLKFTETSKCDKINDVEMFKSHYLSEVEPSAPFKCKFNNNHQVTNTFIKPRLKTRVDFAIEAAVKNRKELIELSRKSEEPLLGSSEENNSKIKKPEKHNSRRESKNKNKIKDKLKDHKGKARDSLKNNHTKEHAAKLTKNERKGKLKFEKEKSAKEKYNKFGLITNKPGGEKKDTLLENSENVLRKKKIIMKDRNRRQKFIVIKDYLAEKLVPEGNETNKREVCVAVTEKKLKRKLFNDDHQPRNKTRSDDINVKDSNRKDNSSKPKEIEKLKKHTKYSKSNTSKNGIKPTEKGVEKEEVRDEASTHGFIDELAAINNFYLQEVRKRKKTDRIKKKRDNPTEGSLESLKSPTEAKVLKQTFLNFSTDKGDLLVSPPNTGKVKRRKTKTENSPDGLKQTSLKNFFSLHLTLN